MKTIAIPLIIFSFLVFTSCYYDKAEIIYTQNIACDTTNVKYSTVVVPILNSNCNGCHGGNAAMGAGIILDNYTSTKVYVDNRRLINSILQNGSASSMPKGGGKLDACTIRKINSWINQGALNN
jgi:hypothetical protein